MANRTNTFAVTKVEILSVAGAILTVRALSPVATLVESHTCVKAVEIPPLRVTEVFSPIQKPFPVSLGLLGHSEALPEHSWNPTAPLRAFDMHRPLAAKPVRPVVKEFLKTVVVPILVERYIARLNRRGIVTGTEVAS